MAMASEWTDGWTRWRRQRCWPYPPHWRFFFCSEALAGRLGRGNVSHHRYLATSVHGDALHVFCALFPPTGPCVNGFATRIRQQPRMHAMCDSLLGGCSMLGTVHRRRGSRAPFSVVHTFCAAGNLACTSAGSRSRLSASSRSTCAPPLTISWTLARCPPWQSLQPVQQTVAIAACVELEHCSVQNAGRACMHAGSRAFTLMRNRGGVVCA
eukprot:357125-Chlamydomonas_euryale.AAC.4